MGKALYKRPNISKLIKDAKVDQMTKTDAGWICYSGNLRGRFQLTLKEALISLLMVVNQAKEDANKTK